MKLKKYLAIMSAVAMVGTSMPVLAADVATYNSKGSITFITNTDITPPVNPENPDVDVTPIDPENPTETPDPGTAGPLSIDFASKLFFGNQKITTAKATYYAVAQKVMTETDNGAGGVNQTESTGPNYVQVTDSRGTESGWTLSVKQPTNFKTAENEVLTGAEITINNINVNSASASTKPSVVPTTLALNTENQVIMAAKKGEGAGTFVARYGKVEDDNIAKSVELMVPAATVKYAKNYTTGLVWTLSDVAPNN